MQALLEPGSEFPSWLSARLPYNSTVVPRDRWLASVGLLTLSTVATTAVFLEIAAHGSSTVLWFHGSRHLAGVGLITSAIIGLTAVMFAILRPWSYPRDESSRAWAALIALVVAGLFGVRFLGRAGPELAPLVWWMLLVAGMCAALVVDSLAGELQRARQASPRARLVRERR